MSNPEPEFRQIFVEEAEQRLDEFGSGLMRIEESGLTGDLIHAVFREAHTLKGGAAMVGLPQVARVAHAMEDILEQIRAGEREPTSQLVDCLLQAGDRLRAVIHRALEGAEDETECEAIVAELHASTRPAVSPPHREPAAPAAVAPTPAPAADRSPGPSLPASAPAPAEVRDTTTTAEARPAPAPEPPTARPEPPAPAFDSRVPVSVQRLDQMVRLVTESASAQLRLGALIREQTGRDPESLREFRALSQVLNELQELTMRTRMVPVSTITPNLQRAVRTLAKETGKSVRWEVRGADTELDRKVLEELAEAILHLVRNAVDHGIESPNERRTAGKKTEGSLILHAMQLGSEVVITVTDDGRGIDIEKVRRAAGRFGDANALSDDDAHQLIFRSGVSTARFVTDISGRGVGLDVVRAKLDAVRGRIEVTSQMGVGCEFRIAVPITLAVLSSLLVRAGDQRYAIPMHSVRNVLSTPGSHRADGREMILNNGRAVGLSDLAQTLGMDEPCSGPILVVAGLAREHAFRVDELLGQRDVVVKGLGTLLPPLDVLAGASIEPDGSIVLVLEAAGLIDRARRLRRASTPSDGPEAYAPAAHARQSVLVVDDARIIRELQRSILEGAGYDVRTAGDGAEALALLAEARPDLVMTDLEMPAIDGIQLTESIRRDDRFSGLPVVILTSQTSDTAKRKGLEAGADAYIVKSSFDQSSLLAVVERLLGAR